MSGEFLHASASRPSSVFEEKSSFNFCEMPATWSRLSGLGREVKAPRAWFMATADHLYDVFLTQTSAHEISRLLEAHYERLPVGVLSIGLHTLARTALVLPASERKALAELPWFGKMMMRLGGMLSGATVTDVKGLTSILWALSCLEQAESPLLQGLVKRLLLLAQHGRVTSAQLLLATQALAKLKQLGGPIGQAVTSIVLPRLADLNAAHLGTLSRALVEGLGVQIGRAHV